jgi:hypothetical protein
LTAAQRAQQATSLNVLKETEAKLKKEQGKELYLDVVKLSTKLKSK